MRPEDIRRERLLREREYYTSEEGFLDFVRDCGAAPDAQQQPHGRYCQDLIHWNGSPDPEAPERTLYKYKLVLWPRGSYKTAVFDVGHICWLIARDPNVRIFVASETETLATQVYKQTWTLGRFGYGAAFALLLSAFVAIVALGQLAILRGRERGMA